MHSPVIDIFIRLGWALLCGFCIFMVPLLFRRASTADGLPGRIAYRVAAVLFFLAFVGVAYYLWTYHLAVDVAAPPEPPLQELPPPSPLGLPAGAP